MRWPGASLIVPSFTPAVFVVADRATVPLRVGGFLEVVTIQCPF
jgi:hypothetical protein